MGWLVGCAILAGYVALAWRLPAQRAPVLSHAGFHWRLWHVDRLGFVGAARMLGTLAVLWLGWATIGALMLSLTGDGAGRALLGELRLPIDLPPLVLLPVLSAGVAVLAVPFAARRAYTDVRADPSCIELRPAWPWPATRLPWAGVHGVLRRNGQLVLRTATGPVVIEAPRAAPGDIDRILAWIEVGRANPQEPEPPQAPPPRALRRLLRAGAVSRATARSARQTPAE